jgi:hypothetical protein
METRIFSVRRLTAPAGDEVGEVWRAVCEDGDVTDFVQSWGPSNSYFEGPHSFVMILRAGAWCARFRRIRCGQDPTFAASLHGCRIA